MESNSKRILQTGKEFDSLFPKAMLKDTIVKKDGKLEETMDLIKQVIAKDQSDTAKTALLLKGNSLRETTQKIWNFVYRHIQYLKDKPKLEEIRRPARLWHDRQTGGDCDCMSVFIGTILANLQIPFTLRIAEYDAGYYQHIYPIVIKDKRFYTQQGGRENRSYYIVIDCVKDQYDAEHPYKKIKDYDILRIDKPIETKNMDLAYLSGLGNTDAFEGLEATAELMSQMEGLGILNDYAVDALGKIKKNKHKSNQANPTAQHQATTNATAKVEVKRFYIRKTHMYRLTDGTIIKMGRFVRQPGERTILFKTPSQSNFVESGILHQAHFFVDNNDTAWGIATVNHSYWKKLPNAGWQQTGAYDYNQASQNRKTPIAIRGYVLKDGTRIFLNKNAPRHASGYPVRWKRAEEESESNTSPWISNGLLVSMYIAENQEFVIGKNGEGNYFTSIGFAQWKQISEDEYFQLKQKALKGFNELGSLLSINGAEELTLNSSPETKGLFIPYDVLEKLFSKRLQPQTKSYQGIAGLGYLLGDNLLDAIAPIVENIEGFAEVSEILSGEEEVAGIFGETEILGMDGYYENVGDLAELAAYPETDLQGNDSLFVADGLGRVRRRKAKRGGDSKAETAKGTGIKKIGIYIPVQVLQQLLKFRNDSLIRIQNKGIEITRGAVPATLNGSMNGFFDVIAAPFKAVAKVAKFLPIPGVSTVANLVDSAMSKSSVPSGTPMNMVTKIATEAIQKIQNEKQQLQNQINQHNATQSQNAAEASRAYDETVNGLNGMDGIGSTAIAWIKDNPVKTALVGAGIAFGGYALYQNQTKRKSSLNGTSKKRKTSSSKQTTSKNKKSKAKKLEVIQL